MIRCIKIRLAGACMFSYNSFLRVQSLKSLPSLLTVIVGSSIIFPSSVVAFPELEIGQLRHEALSREKDASETYPIFEEGSFPFDIFINLDTGPDRRPDWARLEGDAICMAYPSNEDWGAVFISLGALKNPPRDGKNLSDYKTLSLELRGKEGGESVFVAIKDNEDPDDGSEDKVRVSNLNTEWQKVEIPLAEFSTANLENIYIAASFIFEDNPGTVCFRNIEYTNKETPLIGDGRDNLRKIIAKKKLCQQERSKIPPRLCIDPPGIEIGFKYDRLDNNFDDWSESYVAGETWLMQDRAIAYGRFRETTQFNLLDEEVLLGLFALLDRDKRLGLAVEGTLNQNAQVLPVWSIDGQVKYALTKQLRAAAGFNHTEFENAQFNQETFRVEYGNTIQWAYTLELTQVLDAGNGHSNIIEATYYYDRETERETNSRIGLKYLVGKIVEDNITFVIVNDVEALILEGQHFVNRNWAITYSALAWDNGEQYNRFGAGLGIRYRY